MILKDQGDIVTGAGRGIGAATAIALMDAVAAVDIVSEGTLWPIRRELHRLSDAAGSQWR